MINETRIGFNYGELVIGNMLSVAMGSVFSPIEVILLEAAKLAERFDIQTDGSRLSAAIAFANSRREVYGVVDPVLSMLNTALTNPDYFPESPVDFKTIVTHNSDELSESAQLCLDAHAELLSFWRAFSVHHHGTIALKALLSAIGANRSDVFTDEQFPCLFTRGSHADSLDRDILQFVELYDWHKQVLGFTPALPTGDKLLIENGENLSLIVEEDGYVVVGNTLGGRIWLEGTPKPDYGPGSPTLREV